MTEPASSPDTESVEITAAPDTANQDVKPADTSAADQGEGDLLSKVRAALNPQETPDSTNPDQKSEDEPDSPDTEEEDEPGETEDLEAIDEEELTRLNKKTRKRVKHLLGTVKTLSEEVETLKPKAEQLDKVVGFISDSGMSSDEVDFLFKFGRNLKRSPAEAYKQITPVIQTLQRMFGEVLPDDLAQQVKEGKITREAAKAIVVSRTSAHLSSEEAKRVSAEKAKEDEARNNDAHVDRIRSAATEWENRQAKADPDWNRKQPDVMDAIELEFNRLNRAGEQITVEKAVEIAEKAKKKVDERFKQFSPRPTEIKPVTDVTSSPSTPAPKNAVEAAKLALAKMGK
jgi:hypothetical protein